MLMLISWIELLEGGQRYTRISSCRMSATASNSLLSIIKRHDHSFDDIVTTAQLTQMVEQIEDHVGFKNSTGYQRPAITSFSRLTLFLALTDKGCPAYQNSHECKLIRCVPSKRSVRSRVCQISTHMSSSFD